LVKHIEIKITTIEKGSGYELSFLPPFFPLNVSSSTLTIIKASTMFMVRTRGGLRRRERNIALEAIIEKIVM